MSPDEQRSMKGCFARLATWVCIVGLGLLLFTWNESDTTALIAGAQVLVGHVTGGGNVLAGIGGAIACFWIAHKIHVNIMRETRAQGEQQK